VKIHIEITKDLREGIEQLKEKEGRSMNWLVNRAIENFLKIKKAGNEEKTQ
jgi:hypothetical protein